MTALGIVLAHLVGDYLIQSHWMAVEKVNRWWPAIAHGLAHEVGSIETGKLADIVLWRPEYFGAKPQLVLKAGFPAYGVTGDLSVRYVINDTFSAYAGFRVQYVHGFDKYLAYGPLFGIWTSFGAK